MWKERYKIGVPKIDQQHRELFKRAEKFITTVRNDKDLEEKITEIEKTLNFMGEYVNVHFDDEEILQQEIDYPAHEKHKQLHSDFKDYITEFKSEFEQDKRNEELIMEFSGRLMTWLINHVANEDQQISEYLNQDNSEEDLR